MELDGKKKKKITVGGKRREGREGREGEEKKEKNSKQMGRKVKLEGESERGEEGRGCEWWQLMLAEITKGRDRGLYVCWLLWLVVW